MKREENHELRKDQQIHEHDIKTPSGEDWDYSGQARMGGCGQLIAGISRTREFDREILEEIVRTDSKQRYSFNEDKTKIRATPSQLIWRWSR